MTNKLEELFKNSSSAAAYAKGYAAHVAELLQALDFASIEKMADLFLEARKQKKRIFLAGNGGSASTCSHFANDFANLAAEGAEPFRMISLTDNTATITAQANDNGFENIFLNQLKNAYEPGDLLVAISGSGNSENLIRAIKYVNEHGGKTIGIVGFNGGMMKSLCHHIVHIKTQPREYGPVEDICLVLDHLLASYFAYKEGFFQKGENHPCNRTVANEFDVIVPDSNQNKPAKQNKR